MATEHPSISDDDSRISGSSGWLSALKAKLGLPSGANLRDTIEDALLRADRGDETAFSVEERTMLLRLLRYGTLKVEDVMVPRADIIAVDEMEPVADVLQTFVDAGVSRVPLYHETLDDPRGMVHVKDLVKWMVTAATVIDLNKATGTANKKISSPLHDKDHPAPEDALPTASAGPTASAETGTNACQARSAAGAIGSYIGGDGMGKPIALAKVRRPILFVPPSMPAMNLLLRMQSTRIHMALVVDEYGGTDGLVTIEDLVEEIVGEIEDEHDEAETAHITIDPVVGMIASARTPIDELEQRLGLQLLADVDADIDTLGGLVFSLVGRVPARGELVGHPSGVEFEILDADPRRIKKLKIHLLAHQDQSRTTVAAPEPEAIRTESNVR